jgi:hypothetical protein
MDRMRYWVHRAFQKPRDSYPARQRGSLPRVISPSLIAETSSKLTSSYCYYNSILDTAIGGFLRLIFTARYLIFVTCFLCERPIQASAPADFTRENQESRVL